MSRSRIHANVSSHYKDRHSSAREWKRIDHGRRRARAHRLLAREDWDAATFDPRRDGLDDLGHGAYYWKQPYYPQGLWAASHPSGYDLKPWHEYGR